MLHRRRRALELVLLILLANILSQGVSKKSKAKGKQINLACPGLSKRDHSDLEKLLLHASRLLNSDVAGAKSCLQVALQQAPNDMSRAQVLYNLAIVTRQAGDIQQALKYIESASSDAIEQWFQGALIRGVIQLESNHVQTSLYSFAVAKRLQPTSVAVYRNLAQAYYNLGEPLQAREVWEEGIVALLEQEECAEGFFNLGLLLREQGSHFRKQSEMNYKAAIRLDPTSSRYRYSYGNLLFDERRMDEAIAMFSSAIRIDPSLEDARNNLGNALRQSGWLREVLAKCLKLACNSVQQTVFQDLGMLDETRRVADAAYKINPRIVEASILRGSVDYAKGFMREAIERYKEALKLDPTSQQTLLNLGNTYGDLYRQLEARVTNQNSEARKEMRELQNSCIQVYKKMLVLDPIDAQAFLNMVWAQKYACEWANWEENLRRIEEMARMQIKQGKPPSLKPFLALAFPISPTLYLDIARAHAQEEQKNTNPLRRILGALDHSHQLLKPAGKGKSSKLRIAYMSTDLGDHPVGHQAWFSLHDQKRFDVILLALSRNDGSEWWRKNSAMVPDGNFFELGKLGHEISCSDLTRKINKLGVHVLITLNGWTSGHQMDVLSLKPAPIQVEYMGSHDSTGATYIDLFVSDRVATPPEFYNHFTERILSTPDTFFMNEYKQSRAHVPDLADAVYSDVEKLRRDDDLSESYRNIDRTSHDAYLWLLRLPSTAEYNLRKEADVYGEQVASRILFSDRIDWSSHLVIKSLANLSLDNPVFNSHTSAVDILWDEYEALARRLIAGEGRKALHNLRQTLQARRREAASFDTQKLVLNFERGLKIGWDLLDSGLSYHIHVN
ncbi:hypothetical protein GUITHDRAFT_115669 [Guillardia theta CCMP2712]|uniref:protein O-GlcNAc transferase n=1 Tax=Guillardia theta (strain CCMP2712) TaxID=905079 RepID=L1IP98_GUITC|nr:hypothetical protein GUITHDRAFT_115669 [Guillardia theta CCMP2712]EKX38116.1 hypothetical protein GUITHDRAFT_115669 [Guillardia theta CCMP2712]|eukprot:XP_005825096.1 hypothetical protein GUITHDRAFT_115669 [Guillardia theta CCMP2712]